MEAMHCHEHDQELLHKQIEETEGLKQQLLKYEHECYT